MSNFFVRTQMNWVRVSVAALVLLAIALVLPQLAWADHASDHTDGQLANLTSISPNAAYAALVEKYVTGELVYHAPGSRDNLSSIGAYAALVEKYKTGELVYNAPGSRDNLSSIGAYAALVEQYKMGELVFHAPGRRDDRSFGIAPSEAYAALVEKYLTGELVYHAPGRRDDRSFTASVNPAQTDAAFLAANPEAMAYWRHVSAQQGAAAGASSARWVALGAYYTDRAAAFLAANPEIRAFRYNGAQQDCSEPDPQC